MLDKLLSSELQVGPVAVAGAGIGGLTLAIALAQSGVQVDVLERAQSPQGTGAGIQLGPNALQVLDQLGVLRRVARDAFEPHNAVVRRHDTGKPLLVSPLASHHVERYGQTYLHIHRADLMKVLAESAEKFGARLHYNCEVTCIEQKERHVNVSANGRDFRAQILIGADGIQSAVRQTLFSAAPPQFTGQTAWRALVPTSRLPPDLITPDANVWVGPGQHLVAYYVRGGELVNIVAVKEASQWAEESWRTQGDMSLLRAAFSGWDPAVTTLLKACDQSFYWGLFDRPDLSRWHSDRVVLLGDACHPMLPFMAQGAAMAIEDAWVLAELYQDTTLTLKERLATYQTLRQKRTSAIRRLSNQNARLYHASSPTAVFVRNAKLALGSALPVLANPILDRVYGYDVTRLV